MIENNFLVSLVSWSESSSKQDMQAPLRLYGAGGTAAETTLVGRITSEGGGYEIGGTSTGAAPTPQKLIFEKVHHTMLGQSDQSFFVMQFGGSIFSGEQNFYLLLLELTFTILRFHSL